MGERVNSGMSKKQPTFKTSLIIKQLMRFL